MSPAPQAHRNIVDFNVHDLLGIRLTNPSIHDVQIVERHLGLSPASPPGSPAITIHFAERVTPDEPLRFLGRDDVGFTDDAFIILRSHNLARARTSIAMDRIGERFELCCESGLPAIPLLRQLLNTAMLARDILPVHAAAFEYEGQGVMVSGWSHGSKTGTLLAFMAAGAQFVGDEWIYVGPGGDRIYGLPDQLEARPWYLHELPDYQRRIRTSDRIRIWLSSAFAGALAPALPRSEHRNSLPSKIVRQLHQKLLDQQSIHFRPRDLFGAAACTLSSPLDLVIMAISHDSPQLLVTPSTAERVAGQMASSFVHEQSSLTTCYQKHIFAFPDRRNALLDEAEARYRRLAMTALEGKKLHTMLHPYPVAMSALRQAITPLLDRRD